MSPRRPDPLEAEAGASYTRGEVNRAGRLIRRYLDIGVASDFDEALATIGVQEVVGAFRAVTWWRSLHARPLTLVAAGLRYHVDKEHGRIDGHIDVTQRLKRRSTIINKLTREPTMEVAQMHDIGGVRARLPTTGHVYAVSRRLRKTWTIIRVRDYIAEPKASGYRGLHVIVRREGYPIEVQLRSVLQDAWAPAPSPDARAFSRRDFLTTFAGGGRGRRVRAPSFLMHRPETLGSRSLLSRSSVSSPCLAMLVGVFDLVWPEHPRSSLEQRTGNGTKVWPRRGTTRQGRQASGSRNDPAVLDN
jgi:hypothetical protein